MATTDDVAESQQQVVASSSSSSTSTTSLGDSSLLVQRAIDHLVSENKLSESEKEHLETLIQQGDAEILKALKLLSTSEQIEEQILNFLRRFRDQKMEDVSPDPLELMNKACSVMCTEADNNRKISSTKGCLKKITKFLKSLKSNPSKARNRILLKNNFANKKFIFGTPGAVDFLHAIGFSDTEDEKGVEVLQIAEEDASPEKLEKALEILEQTLERLVPIKADAPRIQCKNCQYWGDPQLDGLCSVCNKNKIHGKSPEKEEKPKEPAADPVKCSNGCGFWGSPDNEGMCSTCFKNKHPEKAAKKAAQKAKEKEIPKKHWRAKLKTARVKIDAMRRFQQALATAQKDKTRCWQCSKKIGLMGIQCKCRYFFCGKHRSTLDHACSYDYKTDFERILKAANPIIEARKFDKIDD